MQLSFVVRKRLEADDMRFIERATSKLSELIICRAAIHVGLRRQKESTEVQ